MVFAPTFAWAAAGSVIAAGRLWRPPRLCSDIVELTLHARPSSHTVRGASFIFELWLPSPSPGLLLLFQEKRHHVGIWMEGGLAAPTATWAEAPTPGSDMLLPLAR